MCVSSCAVVLYDVRVKRGGGRENRNLFVADQTRSYREYKATASENRYSDKSPQSSVNFVHLIRLIRIQECLSFKMRTGSSGSGTLG